MESDNTSTLTSAVVISSSENYKLHLGNIQLLAAVDCALGLITLIFNLRQVVSTIEIFPKELRLDDKNEAVDDEGSHIRITVAAVASVCLTLTQLALACLMMVSLSNIQQSGDEESNARTISGVWTLWSAVLLIILFVYASNIKRFETFGDKFYLFMLISEIILRIGIIFYTSLFFWCRCCKHR